MSLINNLNFINDNKIDIHNFFNNTDSNNSGNNNSPNLNQKRKTEGVIFNGIKQEEINGVVNYKSINFLPEFNKLSFEELRYNDYIFNKTGLLPPEPQISRDISNISFGSYYSPRFNFNNFVLNNNKNTDIHNNFFCVSKQEKSNDNIKKDSEISLNDINFKMDSSDDSKNNKKPFNNNNKSSFEIINNSIINNNFIDLKSIVNENSLPQKNKNRDKIPKSKSKNSIGADSVKIKSNNNIEISLHVNFDKKKDNKVKIEINDTKINILVNSNLNIEINNKDSSMSINTNNKNINSNENESHANAIKDNNNSSINSSNSSLSNFQFNNSKKSQEKKLPPFFNNTIKNSFIIGNNNKNIFDLINKKDEKEIKNENDDTSMFFSEKNFKKEIKIKNYDESNDEEIIKINCNITDPFNDSFSLEISKNMEISKIKEIICEKLIKKNNVYNNLNKESFYLMKNYTFIKESVNVENSNIYNGDDIYIVLKKPLDESYN